MTCGCDTITKGVVIDQLAFDTIGVHTKATPPILGGLTSFAAYERFLAEMRLWISRVIRDAIETTNIPAHPSIQSVAADLSRNISSLGAEIPTAIRTFLAQQILDGYEIGHGFLPPGMSEMLPIPELRDAIENQIVRLSKQTVYTSQHSLKEIIGDGISRGETIRDLSERVSKWSAKRGDMERTVKWRATLIARTESSRALNEGQTEAWKAGGIEKMVWRIAANPCMFCAEVKTEPHPVGTPFYSIPTILVNSQGGILKLDYADVMGPPLHPHCRCTLIPEIPGFEIDEDELRTLFGEAH